MSDAQQTFLTSREANQDFSRVKRASRRGPVIITERGRPAQVLLSYADYERLTGAHPGFLDLIAALPSDKAELELPPRRVDPMRDIEF